MEAYASMQLNSIFTKRLYMKNYIYCIDRFGSKDYKNSFLFMVVLGVLSVSCLLNASIIYSSEIQSNNETIHSFSDTIWLMIMASSTVGFGDVYPVTTIGRAFVTVQTLIGMSTMGFLGMMIFRIMLGFLNTDVDNRELRCQLSVLLHKIDKIETHLKLDTTSVNQQNHGVDNVLREDTCVSLFRPEKSSYLALGIDDSGHYIISMNSWSEQGTPFCTWLTRRTHKEAIELYNHFLSVRF